MFRFKALAGAALALAAVLSANQSQADDAYPSRPIDLVVPSTPGGALDVLARVISPLLSEKWGQQVVVDNKPGAGGIVGTGVVANAKPDGYTLLIVTTGLTTNPFLYSNLPYDTKTAFWPITIVASAPNVLLANPATGFKTLDDVIKKAKSDPDVLSYASSGVGSSGHLSMAMLQQRAGVRLIHAAYKGAGAATTALVSGEVQLLFTATGAGIPHIKSGAAIPIAVTSAERFPTLPDVPTVAESGYPGFLNDGWFGVFAPAGTPPDIRNKIYSAISEALQKPETKAKIESLGFRVGNITPEAFGPFIDNELKMWGEIIKSSGIKAE